MDQNNFIVVCTLAFFTVFLLLGALALAMRAITLLFPARHDEDGTALVAAIASSVAVISPGARVVQIEEIPCSPSRRLERSG